MNFLKRGLQSLWAKKGRSLLLIAVFSAILIFVLAGLTIRSAALVATENAQKSVGATVTLQANREQAFQQRSSSSDSDDQSTRPDPGSFQSTPVAITDAQAIADLDGVASYSFEVSTSADAVSGIEPISSSDSSTESEATDSSETGQMDGMPGGMPGGNMSTGDFQITGVSSSAAYTTFSEGTATITDGEGITSEDEGTNQVLIESSLAEANDLAVGDTFSITDAEDNEVEVTIKGIYETSEVGNSMSQMFNFLNPANTIIASYTLANTLSGNEDTIDSATYTLSDPSEMTAFVEEAEGLIDTETYSIQTNDQMYQSMLTPLNNVASFAKNIIVLVAAAGIIILTLIVMMSIRERRYEIGVLLSLGESRAKVILQFFTEIFVCMVFALGIAAASGNLVGNAVGEQLLAQQTETTTDQAATENAGPGGGEMPQMGGNRGGSFPSFTQSAEVESLEITVSPQQIGLLALLGLGISFGSILLSSAGILRLNPKKSWFLRRNDMTLRTEQLGYWYQSEAEALFRDVDLTFEPGKMYAILGSSGSGKTTFLSLITGLDTPKEGKIFYNEETLAKIGLREYRRKDVSIVFQAYNLLPYMSALDNVITAMAIAKSQQADKKAYALANLAKVGITEELALKKVTQLSGGQQQRVAIVRALCCEHELIVADEPTGNLDETTSKEIVKLFQEIAHEQKKCIILVTHEQEVAKACDVVYELKERAFSKIER